MAGLELRLVSRVHRDGTAALSQVSLTVGDGELVVLTGPSGSGKTSVLRVVAGLDPPTSGEVAIGGKVVNDVPTRLRDVALVTQEAALYRYMTAGENLRFPLRVRKVAEDESSKRVAAEARLLRLDRLLDRLPRALSAGHQQRVALGRATTRVPRVFLLDEPLSLLDAADRVRMRAELLRFLRGLAVTTLYVTNDHLEAMALGDRVVVLREGRVAQVGTPQDVYQRPADRFVAEFFGDPPRSFAEAVVQEQGGLGWLQFDEQRVRFRGGLPGPLRQYRGRTVLVGARVHELSDGRADLGAPADSRLRGVVERVDRLGVEDRVVLRTASSRWSARFASGTGPRPGEQIDVVVDLASLPVFDAATGAAIWHGR